MGTSRGSATTAEGRDRGLEATVRAVALALGLFAVVAVTSACVDGPVVEQAEHGSAQGVSATDDASAAPHSEPSTTAGTSPTTTKPKPATTTTEPELPEDDDGGDEAEGNGGEEGSDAGDGPLQPPNHTADSIDYVNERRSGNDRSLLEEDPDLTALAEGWAKQIAAEGNLYHNPNLFQERPPRYQLVGENVAYNSVAGNVDDAWWESDGHRANILNDSYTHIGVAFVQDDGGLWWAVQVFAG